jgi:AcrR family transcriptional regulator
VSARREELLEAAYRHALAHGLVDLSLRPLAAAIGTSPRVLMFLFGNKDGLVRALLARAREDELAALAALRPVTVDLASDSAASDSAAHPACAPGVTDPAADPAAVDPHTANPGTAAHPACAPGVTDPAGPDPAAELNAVVERTWAWLVSPEHRPLLRLWVEAYGRSLVEPHGAWAGFAQTTVDDWLTVLAAAQPESERRTAAGRARRTLALAVLRGCLLDLLASGDEERVGAAVRHFLLER